MSNFLLSVIAGLVAAGIGFVIPYPILGAALWVSFLVAARRGTTLRFVTTRNEHPAAERPDEHLATGLALVSGRLTGGEGRGLAPRCAPSTARPTCTVAAVRVCRIDDARGESRARPEIRRGVPAVPVGRIEDSRRRVGMLPDPPGSLSGQCIERR